MVRRLREAVLGETIRSVEVLRPAICLPLSPGKLKRLASGRKIQSVERRGKNILIGLAGDLVIRVHLRMTGGLHRVPDARLRPAATRAALLLTRGAILFEDPRALGRITIHGRTEADRLLAHLGPEPLSEEFTLERFLGIARSSHQPAKLFLMDQARIAGLGNIYAAEALHRARIHPAQPVSSISGARLAELHQAIVTVLRYAVQSAFTAYARAGSVSEGEDFEPAVYGRAGQPCRVCSAVVRRMAQGGRSTYYCPGCQKPARTRTRRTRSLKKRSR